MINCANSMIKIILPSKVPWESQTGGIEQCSLFDSVIVKNSIFHLIIMTVQFKTCRHNFSSHIFFNTAFPQELLKMVKNQFRNFGIFYKKKEDATVAGVHPLCQGFYLKPIKSNLPIFLNSLVPRTKRIEHHISCALPYAYVLCFYSSIVMENSSYCILLSRYTIRSIA